MMPSPLAFKTSAAVILVGLAASPSYAFVAPAAPLSSRARAVAPSSVSELCMARVPLIAGNWKENPLTLEEATSLGGSVAKSTADVEGVEVAVIPPYPFIYPLIKDKEDSGMKLGGQNCFFEENGAFTGAVSTAMLESMGCEYVLCGHSERRSVFLNDDNAINRKLRAVLRHNMKPILCIGETKSEYDAGLVKSICAIQLAKDLAGVSKEDMKQIVVAYEPIWAIGTGLSATPEIAQSVHSYIRSYIASAYGQEVADCVRIQYGGSVTPDTVDDLMAQPDIDGALVGGASLDAAKFHRIIHYKN